MTAKTFSPERLANIRRMRKARRFFKQTPLFAFLLMQQEFPGYTHEAFLNDLRRRSKPKKRDKRCPLSRYGRYPRIQQLKKRYECTGEAEAMLQAMKLQAVITKPYRMLVRIGKEAMEFSFSALVPFGQIEQLNKSVGNCKTMAEVRQLIEKFRETSNIY